MEEIKYRTTSRDKRGNTQAALAERFPLSTESGYHLDRYKTASEAVKEWIREPYDLGDLEDGVAGGIQGASSIDATQDALTHKLTLELRRYLRDEKLLGRKLFLAKKRVFEMGGELYFQGPDAIAIDKTSRTIETIRYKASAATGMAKGTKGLKPEDYGKLEKFYDLYADLQYVVQNVQEIAPWTSDQASYTVVCNYYFLKKTTDKPGHFDATFFAGGGNPVIGIEEVHSVGEAKVKTELDTLFERYVETATSVGFDCDKENCRFCDYKGLCNFTRSNVKQDKHEVKATALGTPSPAQQAIIDIAWEGPDNVGAKYPYIKINAGAGSGKTFTMVYLVIDLLKKGYDIHDIFVTSFTNAGVNEIRERIAGVAKAEGFHIEPDDIECYTFDSFYYQNVAKSFQALGFPVMPKLLKADVQKQYVEDLVNETIIPDVDYGRMDFNAETGSSSPWIVSAVSKAFNLIQTYHIDPNGGDDSVTSLSEKLAETAVMNSMSENSVAEILKLYVKFDTQLMAENLITYSHLQGLMERLYAMDPNLYARYKYKYIIVDEFQDSNEYQVETIRRMAQTKSFQKMIVVGDDAQAIYGFRDTTPEYIIHFDDYIGHEVKDMYLLENRRSTPEILDVGNAIIAKNKEKIEKSLIPVRPSGDPVFLQGFYSKKEEREFIVNQIEALIQSGKYKPEDICVIDRKRSGLTAIGTLLTEKGIPWVPKVGQNLLMNSKVKAALGLCDAFYDPDVTVHYFDYIVAKHNGQLDDLEEGEAEKEMEDLKRIFSGIDQYEFEDQRRIFHELLDALKNVEDDELYNYFLDLLYDNEDLPSELEYSRIFKKYGDSMEKKLDQSYVGVTLVTAHSAKGLEWPVVFNTVTNYDTAALHRSSLKARKDLEETRRLLFVSTTRARDRLYLTGVYVAYGSEKEGYGYNQFLRELYEIKGMDYDPVDHVKEAEKAAKREAAALRRAERKKSRPSSVSSSNFPGQVKLGLA